jgi:hypothetical protein
MEGLKERYLELYEDMAKSGNPDKMKIFGEAEKWAFDRLHERDPKAAEQWVDKLEATHWHNYLSKSEADEVVAKFINQDGTRGAHWSYDVFRAAVESLSAKMAEEPLFNYYALWATANMIYSDHAQSIAEDMGYKSPKEVPNEKMAVSIYKKALEKLKDADRPRFVREYFDV